MALVRTLLAWLPYVTAFVCVWGMSRRIGQWRRASTSRSPLLPVPSASRGAWRRLAAEVCLLRGIHAGDRGLWLGAWPLHLSLALLAVGHIRAFVDFPGLWRLLGLRAAEVDHLAGLSGGAVGILAMAACLYLLARRALVRRVREITGTEDILALLLLTAVIVTGNAMRFGPTVDLAPIRAYFAGLLLLHPVSLPDVPGFAAHFLLVQVLFAWAPWSKLLHAPGLFWAKADLCR